MKRIHLMFLIIFLLGIISCSQESKIEREARKTMKESFMELAKDPSSVKFENIRTSYVNDSLCIIHFDFTAKNGFGNEGKDKMEYIFLISKGKKYEGFQELDGDSIYVDHSTWEKQRKCTIYEKLSYDDAVRYLAASYINDNGRMLGDTSIDSDFTIELPTHTGKWHLYDYKDDFGESTNDKFLMLSGGDGIFSNSYTANSDLTSYLVVDKEGIFFKLLEYGRIPVSYDDVSYTVDIKDGKGEVHHGMKFWNDGSGRLIPWQESDDKKIIDILNKGGEISVNISYNSYTTRDYKFKLKVDGFKEAFRHL